MEKFNLSDLHKKKNEAEDKIDSGENELYDIREYVENNLPDLIKEASEDYQEIMKKRIADVLENDDYDTARSLINDIKDHVEQLGKRTSLENALEIMGNEQFIGPEDIENTFGFKPDIVPPISFTPEELERAKELGQQLILYVDVSVREMHEVLGNKTSDGKKLFHLEKHAKDISSRIRLGWRLTTPEVIEGSTNKNYLEQTEMLIEYLKNEHFKGVGIPAIYLEAINEFNRLNTPELKEEVSSTDMRYWSKTARKLPKLSINQLTRERNIEIIYRLVINEKKLGVKNLASTYAWSNTTYSDHVELVGIFDDDGIGVKRWIDRPGDIGACFSAGI